MISNHVLWFIAAICLMINSFFLWLWASSPKPSSGVKNTALTYVGATICFCSSAVIVWICIMMVQTVLTKIWSGS